MPREVPFCLDESVFVSQPIMTELANERQLWFDRAFEAGRAKNRIFGTPLSSHALLIEIDLRLAFCAGAWISSIVLACAAVEAKFRQIDIDDFKTKSETLFGENPDLQWLREMRNELMHSKPPGSPSLVWMVDGHDLGETQAALENYAKRAVEIMFRTLYGKK
jgi:hypothetical protein